MDRLFALRRLLLSVLTVALLFGGAPQAMALYPDTRYERGAGYEGTYEWRGVMAYTYIYSWSNPTKHVTSVYIHHPLFPNTTRHMEIGVQDVVNLPVYVFHQYNNAYNDIGQTMTYPDYGLGSIPVGTSQKFVIRNMTMGNPDQYWERWIMSWNDLIVWDELHPLTYGQAWTSSETYARGEDNRAYFSGLKKTSKPANWQSWTANTWRLDGDPTHVFSGITSTSWYNLPN